MSHFQIVCTVLSIIGASACGLASSVVSIQMVNEVNKHLPKQRQMSEAFWYPGKVSQVMVEHARFCPGSNLRTIWRVLLATAVGCLITFGLVVIYK